MADVSILGGLAQDTSVQTGNASLATIATAESRTSTLVPQVFRDGMSTLNAANWDYNSNRATSDLVYAGGNTAAASWVSICKSALVADTYTDFTSTASWPFSIIAAAGLTLSQRIQGQEFSFDIVGVDNTGAVVNNAPLADTQLTTTIAANGSILTINTVSAHGLIPGDVITIYGSADPRLNLGPVVVSSWISATSFTIASSYTSGTYTTGAAAYVRFVPPDSYATYSASQRFWGTSSTNADVVTKNSGRMPETVNWNPVTSLTDATYPSENGINYSGVNYSYPQRPRYEFSTRLHSKYAKFFIRPIDSNSLASSTVHRSQNFPDPSRNYKLRFRGRNLPNLMIPVGPITTAAKTGTAVATLTIPNHGLTTSDYVYIYGIRDQTNFGNQGTAIQIASVPTANTITVSFGTAVTATSYGGFLLRAQGNTSVPGLASSAVQTYARTADAQRLTLSFAANPSTPVVGEVWTLFGLVDSTNTTQTALQGRYRVEYINGTTFVLELTPLDGQVVSTLSTTPTNAGGTVIRNTELRVHFVRAETEQNSLVEILGGEGDQDIANAIQVNPVANSAVNLNQLVGTSPAAIGTQGTRNALGIAATAIIANTDRTAAAITATANSGTVADDYGNALSALIAVSAVTGTTPRLDVALQESFDNGTTFQDIFHLPRITASGNYLVPYQLIGGRRRWNYTINGTTPSFTLGIISNRGTIPPTGVLRNFFDYTSNANGTINVNTLNSVTPSWYVEGCKDFTFTVSMGAVTTTAPVFQVQMSPDNATWFNIGTALTGTASTNLIQNIANTPARYIRILVSTAGVGATTNFVNFTGR